MANLPISALDVQTTLLDTDLLVVVDTTDHSMALTGTDKQITAANVIAGVKTALTTVPNTLVPFGNASSNLTTDVNFNYTSSRLSVPDVRVSNSVQIEASSGGGDFINIVAPPVMPSSYTITLPDQFGTSGDVFSTSGFGVVTYTPTDSAATVSTIMTRDVNANTQINVLGRGVTSTATAAGTTTLLPSSTANQIFTGVTTQTVRLPDVTAANMAIGFQWIITNQSTGVVTVQTNSGLALSPAVALSQNQSAYCTVVSLTNNLATSWVLDFIGTTTGTAVSSLNTLTGALTMSQVVAVNDAGAAGGATSVIIGSSATASTADSIAIGRAAAASVGTGNVSIGQGSIASNTSATALGVSANASGSQATALGNLANASNTNATALGVSANASNTNATALGVTSTASGASSTAVGRAAIASNTNATALGVSANASGSGSIALGVTSTASGASSTALGVSATASNTNATALGRTANASGANSIALGISTTATQDGAIAIGNSADSITGTNGIAIGTNAQSQIGNGIAIGNAATVLTGTNSIAIGTSTKAAGTNSVAIGREAMSASGGGTSCVGIGYGALFSATGGSNVAMGSFAGSAITTGGNNTIVGTNALGNSVANVNYIVAIGDSSLSDGPTADRTVAVGAYSLYALTSGVGNTHVGNNVSNTVATTTGSDNTFVGDSITSADTASNNTIIGSAATGATFAGCSIFGKGATATADNQLVLRVGNSATTELVSTLAVTAGTGVPIGTEPYITVVIGGNSYKIALRS